MKDMLSIIKEEELLFCLSYLLAGVPKTKALETAEKYCAIYREIHQEKNATEFKEVLITGYKHKVCKGQKIPVYRFWGIPTDYLMEHKDTILNNEELLESIEQPIGIDKLLNGTVRYIIPDSMYEELNSYGQKYCKNHILVASLIWFAASKKRIAVNGPYMDERYFEETVDMSEGNIPMEQVQKDIVDLRVLPPSKTYVKEYLEQEANGITMTELLGYYVPKPRGPVESLPSKSFSQRVYAQNRGFVNVESPVMKILVRMDEDNPPNRVRCHNTIMTMKNSVFHDLGSYIYKIMIEKNDRHPELPFIYVIDRDGEKHELREFEVERLNMAKVNVLDSDLTDYNKVLALLVYYIEYPIRVKRMQKEITSDK